MDIFTTQLTRVVPVPIKPASLKVKALTKNAATDKLTDDIDHLENHEQYFKKKDDGQQETSEHQGKHCHDVNEDGALHKVERFTDHTKTKKQDDDDDVHHLDLFI
ncbi:MAG: hypothetical protein ACI9LM_002045 [Alteromonadaceae bacterium]|jgi:hypothetical protein